MPELLTTKLPADPDESGFYPGERSWDDAAGIEFAAALFGYGPSPTGNRPRVAGQQAEAPAARAPMTDMAKELA